VPKPSTAGKPDICCGSPVSPQCHLQLPASCMK